MTAGGTGTGRTTAVRARGVAKTFGDVVALDHVDLDVEAGQVHGLIGPNGAGKSTLLGLLLGLAVADAGRLEILGTPVGRSLVVPAGVAGFVDEPGLYPSLTARQNLTAFSLLRGGPVPDVEEALDQVGLRDVADDRVRGFSLGMRQRLGLASAMLDRPRLLVLDEPANGLDPAGRRHVNTVIARLAEAGTAVVLSSHRMDDLAELCSEVTLLSTGRVVFSGPVEKLAAETGDLDHRLRTTDVTAAAGLVAATPGLRLVPAEDRTWTDPEVLVVRGPAAALDALVARLVGAGIGLRELGPVVPPLEAAFLALTADDDDDDRDGDGDHHHDAVRGAA
ncbi:ABC transporter ATP-binding protein [Microlunatus spumicola]|uniref:ABC transporter ATP-binding protein n=1 Tax=Microlunatus spumicola TaxID=81499 RepID=A0ABP6WM92_9ACTN